MDQETTRVSVGLDAADARDGAKPLDQVGGVERIFLEAVELQRESSARESNDFDCRRFQSDPLSSEPVSEIAVNVSPRTFIAPAIERRRLRRARTACWPRSWRRSG